MNRDALLATLIGFGIGLLITAGIILGPTIAKSLPNIKLPAISLKLPTRNTQTSPTPTAAPSEFKIDSPLADAVENSDTLLVSGTAPAGSTVIIQGPFDEAATDVKDDGKYAGKVQLTEGQNDIVVTSYKDGKTETKTVTVYYTPEEF